MAGFSFGGISSQQSKHILKFEVADSIVLQDKRNSYARYPHTVVILADEFYTPSQLEGLHRFLLQNGVSKYILLASILTKCSHAEAKNIPGGLISYYATNASNFWEYIPKDAVIVTIGSALYSVTKLGHIYPSDMQQRIFGKARIWCPRDPFSNNFAEGRWVYPIETIYDIFADNSFTAPLDSYKTKLVQLQLRDAISCKDFTYPDIVTPEIIEITTKEAFHTFYEKYKTMKNRYIAWDLETSGFNFLRDTIGCFTCSFDGKTGYFIDWAVIDPQKLNDILKNNIQIGANLKFDIKFLWKQGIPSARVHEDVIALGHVLDETRTNALKALTYYYTPYGGYDAELQRYLAQHPDSNYLEIPRPFLVKYATLDAIVTYQVFIKEQEHCRTLDITYPNEKGTSWAMYDFYKKIVIPAINMYAKIEYNGVYINLSKLLETRKKLITKINTLQKKLAKALGVSLDFSDIAGERESNFGAGMYDANLQSNQELARILEAKGWEDLGRQKNGLYQCSDFQLTRWAKKHKEAQWIQELRTCQVILNAFIGTDDGKTGWPQYLKYHPEDNSWRMHPNFGVMATESGRSRCSKPNMQNVPTHGLFAKEVKECLCTPNDDQYYMVTIDFSALQLRLAAIDGDDAILCKLFKDNPKKADIHSKTAYGLFVQNKEWDVTIVEVEQDGNKYTFLGGELVQTKNRGEIFARDLEETDILAI